MKHGVGDFVSSVGVAGRVSRTAWTGTEILGTFMSASAWLSLLDSRYWLTAHLVSKCIVPAVKLKQHYILARFEEQESFR